jgi:hypothetical protein
MKLLGCSLLMATLAMTAAAADVSGTWAGSLKGSGPDGQDGGVTLVLKQAGTEITGTAGPSADHQMPIQKGKIEGDKIALEVPVGDGLFKFELVVEGEHIKGDVSASMGDQQMKAKVDVTRAK